MECLGPHQQTVSPIPLESDLGQCLSNLPYLQPLLPLTIKTKRINLANTKTESLTQF